MANKPNPADFSPTVPDFPSIGQYQPIYGKFDLTTYIQGASDYEIMAFLVQCYNATLKGYGEVTQLSKDTVTAYNQLQTWVNTWFDNLDVQSEINAKLQKMYENGSLAEAIASSDAITPAINNRLNAMAADGTLTDIVKETAQVPPAVTQYLNTVDGYEKLSNATAEKINNMATTGELGTVISGATDLQQTTTDWLHNNVTPVGSAVVVDKSLTIEGAAADSKATGNSIDSLKNDLNELQNGGYVADQQQIGQKVNTWLDEHPEATTTVQDNSLTLDKFTDELKLYTKKDYVTPQMFGAKADGKTNDSNAIQQAIDSGITVFLPKGIYNIGENTLNFTKFEQYHSYSFIMDINSVINYSGTDCAIKILKYGISEFKVGTINAPNGDGINSVSNHYTNGGGYLTIMGGTIRAGKNAIIAGTSYTTGYSNEIRIYDTDLIGGEYGFHVVNYVNAGAHEENTYINHYKLFNVSFEGMTNGYCMFFESTGTAAIEDIFLYNLRTTEPLLKNVKLLKSVGKILRVTGVLSDPIFTNVPGNIKHYIEVGSGAKDWNILISNEYILTVTSEGFLRINKTNLIRSQSLTLPANYTYRFTEPIDESTCYLLTLQGETNTDWRYAGILFLANNGSQLFTIVSNLITVTVDKVNISIHNASPDYDMNVYASLVPLNNVLVSALLTPDN